MQLNAALTKYIIMRVVDDIDRTNTDSRDANNKYFETDRPRALSALKVRFSTMDLPKEPQTLLRDLKRAARLYQCIMCTISIFR